MPEIIKLPGMVDMHVHLREPGGVHKEDWTTGTSAAVAGGVVAIVDMPNTNPPTTTLERLEEKEKIAKEKSLCDFGFYFGSDGSNLSEFNKVYDHVCGLKLYLNETTGSLLIEDEKKIADIFKAWPRGKPILVHAEGDVLDYALALAEKNYHKLHCCHVASKADIERLAAAKTKGSPVTCEVSPHHLFLTQEDIGRLGPFGMMKPALGTEQDQAALWEHIQEGTVDCIATDHAPHTKEEKKSATPPWGVPGLETALPLLVTAMIGGRLTREQLTNLTSVNPWRILGSRPPVQTSVEIEIGIAYQLDESQLKTKCGWSPFAGMMLKARVVRTVIHGVEVYKDGKIMSKGVIGKNIV
jgi:carbamoyl-phosphate synthase/aspartate carbamoyltransferase/dihydroorotase